MSKELGIAIGIINKHFPNSVLVAGDFGESGLPTTFVAMFGEMNIVGSALSIALRAPSQVSNIPHNEEKVNEIITELSNSLSTIPLLLNNHDIALSAWDMYASARQKEDLPAINEIIEEMLDKKSREQE